jgi:7-carboxy-7-deazaguanine synthase
METVKVSEIFTSIQGESTYVGLSCFFIRLSGCNLRCEYCDTRYAYEEGQETSVDELVAAAASSSAAIVQITGGEPLLQAAFPALAKQLRDRAERPVLVETNGSQNIALIPEGVRGIVDVKTPGSGEGESFDPRNVALLRPYDEVKFVISDRADYLWAKAFLHSNALASCCGAVLFSPVAGRLAAADLASWVLKDGLPVRVQVQLHKVLGIR